MTARPMLVVLAVGLVAPAPAADTPDRAALLKKLEQAMGPMPTADRKVPLDVTVIEETKQDGYVRRKITYAAEKGDRVPAWLLIPTASPGRKSGEVPKRPAMLCLHQTIPIGKDEPVGLGKQESKRQALHLVRRGYVCLAPDYPSFGEYKYDFQAAFRAGLYQSGTMKAIWNNMRGVDLLQSLPEVDPERIGAIGHSLGGHNAMYTAAFDDRIKVTVSSCGFNSFYKYYGGNLKGWTSDRYMPRIASEYGNDPKRVPFDFDDVVLAICPRVFFAMSPLKDSNFEVSGVKDVMAKVRPVYEELGAGDKLKAIHPDAGHEWPEEARREAYEFIDRCLKP
jgi:dienelactone hydrolase